jgi:hypothetical protein
MPSAEEILRSLKYITDHYFLVAIGWHLLIYLSILLYFLSRRKPSPGAFGFWLSIPLFSVAMIALLADNPFNGIIFFILAVLFLIFSFRSTQQNSRDNLSGYRNLGFIFILAGCFYPHFSDNYNLLFLEAPVGLIPCPTLLVMIGFAILLNLRSKALIIMLVSASLFYGFWGVFRLKVIIDIVLFIGIVPLLWQLLKIEPKKVFRDEQTNQT